MVNAVKYGPDGPIRVELDVVDPAHVRGRVAEHGDCSEVADAPRILESPGAHGGYGLRLVDDLTSGWGLGEHSTAVWFELGG